MSVRIKLSADGSVCNISIIGQFDVGQSTRFEDALLKIPGAVDIIRIDLAEMLSSDATFMSSILLLREQQSSCIIELFNCSKKLVRRFSMAGIDRLVRLRLAADGHIEDTHNKRSTDNQEQSDDGSS